MTPCPEHQSSQFEEWRPLVPAIEAAIEEKNVETGFGLVDDLMDAIWPVISKAVREAAWKKAAEAVRCRCENWREMGHEEGCIVIPYGPVANYAHFERIQKAAASDGVIL